MKFVVISVLAYFGILASNRCLAQNKTNVDFEIKSCNDHATECACEVDVFKKDTNISFTYLGNHRLTGSDNNLNCQRTDLIIYHHKISLDSLYKSHIRRKDIPYMSGLCESHYLRKGGIITLTLTFINCAINSSRPTTHEYTFVYDEKERKIITNKFRFINE